MSTTMMAHLTGLVDAANEARPGARAGRDGRPSGDPAVVMCARTWRGASLARETLAHSAPTARRRYRRPSAYRTDVIGANFRR